MIDVTRRKVNLQLGDEILKFDIKKIMNKHTIDGQMFWIETMDELVDELLEELPIEDSLQVELTRKHKEQGFIDDVSDALGNLLDSHKFYNGDASFLELDRVTHNVSVVEIKGVSEEEASNG